MNILPIDPESIPLMKYADSYWPLHARIAEEDADDEVSLMALDFLLSNGTRTYD